VLGVGCWVLGVGYWILGVGYWVLGVGCWVLDIGYWILDIGCWVLGVAKIQNCVVLWWGDMEFDGVCIGNGFKLLNSIIFVASSGVCNNQKYTSIKSKQSI
jgi:hypothetical protein